MKTPHWQLPTVPLGRKKLVNRLLFAILVVLAALGGAVVGLTFVYSFDLPQIEELEHYRPISATEVYDDQGRPVGSFALQRRIVASYNDYPPLLREAVISIEDKNFEKHWGVSVRRILGAAYRDIISGGKLQGASTLTMQLSRNLFLSPEQTFRRKIEEILLAVQIERRFTKQQIFTLYANQIFLGHGIYGFETGAEFYFGKHAKELSLPEAALLAGLPKGPAYYSPLVNPEKSVRRRNLVINALLEDGKITAAQASAAKEVPLKLNVQSDPNWIAPYFIEEVRRYLEKKYGSDQVHQAGLRVYTSLDLDLQKAANQSVLDGLAAYERRHGWKGNLQNVLRSGSSLAAYENPSWQQPLQPGTYQHALITNISPKLATAKLGRHTALITAGDIAWTHYRLSRIFKPGDVVYVIVLSLSADGKVHLSLEQDSGVQGALVAIDNATGDIKAMVGGRDFETSKFNRATQAYRQAGSSFKPFVYTAAIDQGATPDDVIVDEPTAFVTPSGPYTPHNFDEKFEGSITLRRALAHSRNVPAVKMTEHLGIKTVVDYARRFGITSQIPAYLPLALGSADLTLMEQTSAYSVFPDDGVRLLPRSILKVTDYDGRVLEENFPQTKDVISSSTARTMTSMLREVVLHGTATAAIQLNFPIAGKTGTTNNFTDAWFVGFSPSITCGVWVGFDEKRTLGSRETGAFAALPIWMNFMRVAHSGREPRDFPAPPFVPPNAIAQKLDTPDFAPAGDETH